MAMSSVTLWTKITNDCLCRKRFAYHIAHTKNAPLRIVFHAASYSDWEGELALILPYKDRWYSFVGVFVMHTEDVARRFPNMVFPRLEIASFCLIAGDSNDKFFSTWGFPKLKELTLVGTIPAADHFIDIVSLNISMMDVYEDHAVIQRILKFLSRLHRLENLTMDLTELPRYHVDTTRLEKVKLPAVKNLSVCNSTQGAVVGERCSATVTGQLFSMLEVPNANNVRLSLQFDYFEFIAIWAMMFYEMGAAKCLETVTSLSIVVPNAENPRKLEFFLKQFTNVENLELDGKYLIPALLVMPTPVNLKRLRSLVLKIRRGNLPRGWKDHLYKLTPNVDRLDVTVK